MQAERNTTDRNYTDEEIRLFVEDLESLPGGDLTVSLLVGCGERAIPPLQNFLLHGKPRGIFQPRQRAVEALGQLNAKDVLMEYLSQKREIADAVVRFGEEAVENTAARELARWLTDDVYTFLLARAEQRRLPGVIETLGKFERPEAAEVFIRALGDDVARPVAEDALRRVAGRAKPALIQAARRVVSGDDEKPSERQTRRSVMRILCELPLREREWAELKPLLRDRDKEIAILAAEIAVDSASSGEKREAAHFLIHSLAGVPWFLQTRISDCLQRNYSSVCELLEEESKARRRTVKGEPLSDPVVRILEKVRSEGEKCSLREQARNG